MAQSYGSLAAYYDRLMAHVDYDAWTSFALQALGLDAAARPTLLDLACGTGTMATRFAEMGVRVVGIDGSEDMLAVADGKARALGLDIDLYCQDLTAFRVDAPADGAVCLFDSLNYLTRPGDLGRAVRSAARALKPGAKFLFDLHTEERLREISSETYVHDDDDLSYIWQSEYDENDRICTMNVTLFALVPGSNMYRRFDEVHRERAFDGDEVEAALDDAGFRLNETFGELTMRPPQLDERRVFYLAEKC